MQTISEFMENRRKKADAQHQVDRQHAVVNRDLMGPAYSAKGRKRDMKALTKGPKAPAMTNDMGVAFPAMTKSEIGDGYKSKNRKKAVPKYNATRPMGDR
jgi:hypothetical protein